MKKKKSIADYYIDREYMKSCHMLCESFKSNVDFQVHMLRIRARGHASLLKDNWYKGGAWEG